MANSVEAIQIVLGHEGPGVVADDNGRGPSRWGVTLETAHQMGFDWDAETIRTLTREEAAAFYQAYWNESRCGLLASQDVANKVFDLAVNLGTGTAVRILQQACGSVPDGVLGPATAAAANDLDPDVLMAKIREAAAAHYRQLVADNPALAPDLPGWISRLDS